MIRNVVTGRLRDADSGSDIQQLHRGLDGINSRTWPGLIDMRVGLDLGLRKGGWTFAITNDWVDADAYRNYGVPPIDRTPKNQA